MSRKFDLGLPQKNYTSANKVGITNELDDTDAKMLYDHERNSKFYSDSDSASENYDDITARSSKNQTNMEKQKKKREQKAELDIQRVEKRQGKLNKAIAEQKKKGLKDKSQINDITLLKKIAGKDQENVLCIGREKIEEEYGAKLTDFRNPITFCGSMEMIHISGPMQIDRISMTDQKLKATARLEGTKVDGTKNSNEQSQKVTCLHCPRDQQPFLIIGYSRGFIEIRDSKTFEEIYFQHHLLEGGEISLVEFHLEQYANLRVIHKNGLTSNLILERREEAAKFELKDNGLKITGEKKNELEIDPIAIQNKAIKNQLELNLKHALYLGIKEMFQKKKSDKEEKAKIDLKELIQMQHQIVYNDKLYYKPFVLATDKRVFLTTQSSMSQITFQDLEKSCYEAQYEALTFTIQDMNPVKFMFLQGTRLILCYENVTPTSVAIVQVWDIDLNEEDKSDKDWRRKPHKLKKYKTFNLDQASTEAHHKAAFEVVKSTSDCGYSLIISLWGTMKRYKLSNLAEEQSLLKKSLTIEIVDLRATPCRKILVVNQVYSFEIWDTMRSSKFISIVQPYTFTRIATSDFVLFETFKKDEFQFKRKNEFDDLEADNSIDVSQSDWLALNMAQNKAVKCYQAREIRVFPLNGLKDRTVNLVLNQSENRMDGKETEENMYKGEVRNRISFTNDVVMTYDFKCSQSRKWKIFEDHIIYMTLDRENNEIWTKKNLKEPKFNQELKIGSHNSFASYTFKSDSKLDIFTSSDKCLIQVYRLRFDELLYKKAIVPSKWVQPYKKIQIRDHVREELTYQCQIMSNKESSQILVNFWRGPAERHVVIVIETGEQQPLKNLNRAKQSPDFAFVMSSKASKFVLTDIRAAYEKKEDKTKEDDKEKDGDEEGDANKEKEPINLLDGDTLLSSTNQQYRGFTPDSQYCFFNTQDGYQFVRTFDESPVCTLPKGYLMIVDSDSNSYVLKGIIDRDSRKYFKWHDDLENFKINAQDVLVHTCPNSLNLTKEDFPYIEKQKEEFDNQEWEILGQPMPALYPLAIKQMRAGFFSNQVVKKDLFRSLNQYTLTPSYTTIMHDFSQKKNDQDNLAQLLDKDEARFIEPRVSLILRAQPAQLKVILNHLLVEEPTQSPEKNYLTQRLPLESIINMLKLPQEELSNYLDLLYLQGLQQEIDLDEDSLTDNVVFYELEKVTDMKIKSTKEEVRKHVTNPVKEKPDFDPNAVEELVETVQSSLTVISFKLPFVGGSKLSMKLLNHLCKLQDSEIFNCVLIQRILDYKWTKVRYIGFFFTFIYFLYLMCITLVKEQEYVEPWKLILGWACYFILVEVFQICNGFGDGNSWLSSFWNLFDASRVSFMGAYIAMVLQQKSLSGGSGFVAVCTNCDDSSASNWQPEITFEAGGSDAKIYKDLEYIFFCMITLESWISFLQYLRFFAKTRILIAYISASAKAMIPFMLIIVIMLATFTLTHYQVVRKIEMQDEDFFEEKIKFQDIFIMQYKLMYGEFFDTETSTEYILLLGASLLVPLLMLNLLIAIISEAHAEVVDNKVRQDYAEICNICLELEGFMFWNRKNIEMKHLVVAENAIPTSAQPSEGASRAIIKQFSKTLTERNIPSLDDLSIKFDEKLEVVKEKLIKDIVKALKDRGLIHEKKGSGETSRPGTADTNKTK